jgi:signal transduction histidine kinase
MEVKDTGIGIPKDKIPDLFKKYSTVEQSKDLNPNAIGLGLYICKRVVNKCGGEIQIKYSANEHESPLNHGTIFSFTMPITLDSAN